MGAKHGAKKSAAWTRELGLILLDGIEANQHGKETGTRASEGFASSAAREGTATPRTLRSG